MGKRWVFPLPFPDEERGHERGINIASTALQLDWSFEGEELNISPITHPEQVHEFIRNWPGLYECARENPGVLALYVPQITIPGFDTGFEDVFDQLLALGSRQSDMIFSYGRHDTIDEKEPLCGDVIAFRHPTFGNYTPSELGKWYFDAHDTNYIRSLSTIFEGLVWLLSENSTWLPHQHRSTLLQGIKMRDHWTRDGSDYQNLFFNALYSKKRKQFKLTKTVIGSLRDKVTEAIINLGISENSDVIIQRMLDIDLINSYYDYHEWLKSIREENKKQRIAKRRS